MKISIKQLRSFLTEEISREDSDVLKDLSQAISIANRVIMSRKRSQGVMDAVRSLRRSAAELQSSLWSEVRDDSVDESGDSMRDVLDECDMCGEISQGTTHYSHQKPMIHICDQCQES